MSSNVNITRQEEIANQTPLQTEEIKQVSQFQPVSSFVNLGRVKKGTEDKTMRSVMGGVRDLSLDSAVEKKKEDEKKERRDRNRPKAPSSPPKSAVKTTRKSRLYTSDVSGKK